MSERLFEDNLDILIETVMPLLKVTGIGLMIIITSSGIISFLVQCVEKFLSSASIVLEDALLLTELIFE